MGVKSVCWNLTCECNLDCQYCFRELYEEAQNFEYNLNILNNLKNIGVERITFSGGEPFLYPKILELIEEAHNIGIQCYVVTNGTLLNGDNVEDYLKYIDKVSFSCDSVSPWYNEEIGRGSNSYNHIKEVIQEIRKRPSLDHIKIDINTVLTKFILNDYKELDNMYQKLSFDLLGYDLNKWKIIRFYPLRGLAKKNEDKFRIPDEIFANIKAYFSMVNSSIKVDIRDISDMDDNYIVSPCGLLKKSSNGSEEVICDLKDIAEERKGGQHVQ